MRLTTGNPSTSLRAGTKVHREVKIKIPTSGNIGQKWGTRSD